MKKILFLTGLNRYSVDEYGEGATLTQAVNDCHKVERLLAPWADLIIPLYNEDALETEVLATMEYILQKLDHDGTVVWYNSGHGTEWADAKSGKVYTGRCLYRSVLWDAEIEGYASRFAEGQTVVFISDTCHAQGNNKRLTQGPPPDVNYMAPKKVPWTKSLDPPSRYFQIWKIPTAKANLVYISACLEMQLSWETENGGIFTQALERASGDAPGTVTLETWWYKLTKTMKTDFGAFNQKPHLYRNTRAKKSMQGTKFIL